MTRSLCRPHALRWLLALLTFLDTGCEEGSTGVPEDSAAAVFSLVEVSGDSQAGEVDRLLDQFLVFRVIDGAGRPVSGLRVEWEIVSGGGKVSGKRHETDIEGLAAGNFTLGPLPGEHRASAVVLDSLAIEFTAFAVPPSPEEPLP